MKKIGSRQPSQSDSLGGDEQRLSGQRVGFHSGGGEPGWPEPTPVRLRAASLPKGRGGRCSDEQTSPPQGPPATAFPEMYTNDFGHVSFNADFFF